MVLSDPLVPPDTRHARKCTATSKRSGKPCERWSMVGQQVCMMHGGKSQQALAKAEEAVQLAELKLRGLAPIAVQELENLVTHAESEPVRLAAARDLADRSIGKAVEKIQVAAQVAVVKPW